MSDNKQEMPGNMEDSTHNSDGLDEGAVGGVAPSTSTNEGSGTPGIAEDIIGELLLKNTLFPITVLLC